MNLNSIECPIIIIIQPQMLTSKRYDLEGFAEYAHHLSDCQSFHKSEAKHIDYVLRVHSTLRRNGVKVPQEDEVSHACMNS